MLGFGCLLLLGVTFVILIILLVVPLCLLFDFRCCDVLILGLVIYCVAVGVLWLGWLVLVCFDALDCLYGYCM